MSCCGMIIPLSSLLECVIDVQLIIPCDILYKFCGDIISRNIINLDIRREYVNKRIVNFI